MMLREHTDYATPRWATVWKQVLLDLLFKGFLVLLALCWGLGLILAGIKH